MATDKEHELPLVFDQTEPAPPSSKAVPPALEINTTSQPFSKYIVYVDESGDHGMQTIDPQFPVFVLAFCVFREQQENRAFEALKKKFFCSGGRSNVGVNYQQWGLKIHPPPKNERPR